MTWIFFLLGALVFIGAGSLEVKNWRNQIHSWFGVWTGVAIMIIAMIMEYTK